MQYMPQKSHHINLFYRRELVFIFCELWGNLSDLPTTLGCISLRPNLFFEIGILGATSIFSALQITPPIHFCCPLG